MSNNSFPKDNQLKVGLYFGSFNPIHTGHLNLAQYLIENSIVDQVWFIVSPNNPLKDKSELLDHYVRLEMVKLAIQGKPYFKACDIEFNMPVPSYTIDTLDLLSKTNPDMLFSLIIGTDNALIFDKWKNYERILEKYPVLVYPRRDFNIERVKDKFPQMEVLSTPYYDISSTEIRSRIAEGKDYSMCVSPEVCQFIKRNNLYKKAH